MSIFLKQTASRLFHILDGNVVTRASWGLINFTIVSLSEDFLQHVLLSGSPFVAVETKQDHIVTTVSLQFIREVHPIDRRDYVKASVVLV